MWSGSTTTHAAASVQVCFALDGSGSLSSTDFDLEKEGVAAAIEDPSVVPQDGSVEVSVVQFSLGVAKEVPPTVITSQASADAVAAAIRAIVFQSGSATAIGDAIAACTSQITGSGKFGGANLQAINVSTDGENNFGQDPLTAATNAVAAGIDRIDAEALGAFVNPAALLPIVRPQPAEKVTPPAIPSGETGFVYNIVDIADYAEAIRAKLGVLLGGISKPRLSNLWLCNQDALTCENKASGVEALNLPLRLNAPVRGLDPKCIGFPNFADPSTCDPQTIGAFEFEVRYDAKYVDVDVTAGSIWDTGGVPFDCTSIEGEGFEQFRCNTKGKPAEGGITGPGDLAIVHVTPTADVYGILIASQLNGIATQLINQDCQLADTQGHPLAIPVGAGGTADPCGDAAVTIRYLEGDVHADCVIDVRDQQQIAFRWGSALGQLLYNSRYDLEPSYPKLGDSDIDAKDLQLVYGRAGSTCKEPHPAQDPVDPKSKEGEPVNGN
jgi:hypothetical protein